jgi:plastocyanin
LPLLVKKRMSKIKIISVVLVGFLIVATVILFYQEWSASSPSVPSLPLGQTWEVIRTNDGYEPAELTIKAGDQIIWKNQSDNYHWPASDLHPTHGVYPEFDPLQPVGPEEDWVFQFTQTGDWRFHDHLRANKTGVVHVIE